MAYWLYQSEVWIILGVLFIMAELLDGSAIFFLPFGIGALFNAALVRLQAWPDLSILLIFNQWWQMFISWSAFALVAFVLLRIVFFRLRRRQEPDINQY